MKSVSKTQIITFAAVLLLFVLVVALIINLVRIGTLSAKADELRAAYNANAAAISQNDKDLEYRKTDLYYEQYVRENLDMRGEGEILYIGKP